MYNKPKSNKGIYVSDEDIKYIIDNYTYFGPALIVKILSSKYPNMTVDNLQHIMRKVDRAQVSANKHKGKFKGCICPKKYAKIMKKYAIFRKKNP